MKAEVLLNKNGVFAKDDSFYALLKFHPKALSAADKKKKIKKNLSFVIDVSGSMDGNIKKVEFKQDVAPYDKLSRILSNAGNPQPGFVPPNYDLERGSKKTRLNLVVEATILAISELDENDYASVVTFSDNASVVAPAAPMNKENKERFILLLKGIRTQGMTNLYDGWLEGVNQVQKNFSSEFVNRVIVLTDGETNVGLGSGGRHDDICTNISKVNAIGVSTTTIGVGDCFNEVLLQRISQSGAGNSYYIDDEDSVRKSFEVELLGISNISAKELKVKVSTIGLKLLKNMNEYEMDGEWFKLPSLSNTEIKSLFKFEANSGLKKGGTVSVSFEISYVNTKGNKKTLTLTQTAPVLSKKEVEVLEENKDVKLEVVMANVALEKMKAQEEYRRGNTVAASGMLARSAAIASDAMMFYGENTEAGARLMSEVSNLNNLSATSLVAGNENFAKTLAYQSFNARNSQVDLKDIDKKS